MGSLATLLWLVNVVLDTGGQLAFKAAASDPNEAEGLQRWKHMLSRPWLWLGIACYVLEFVAWIAFLSLVPLSKGVLLGSINIVALMIAGRILFREKLTPLRVTGMLLVTAGVAVVGGRLVRRLYVIGFPLLMAFDTLAQLCFKYAGDAALPVEANTAWLLRVLSQPWVYGAILGYVGAFFTWMSLLRHAPIGPAFAASHLEVISVLLLSAWLLNEPLTLHHLLGAVLIVAGIVCLGRAEADDPHSPAEATT